MIHFRGSVSAIISWLLKLGDLGGLDITVYSSDTKRSAGHLSRQGPPLLRRALYEAAKSAARATAPDHAFYIATRDRRDAGLATVSLARRAYHTLRDLGQDALQARSLSPSSSSGTNPARGRPFTDELAAGSRPGVCCQDLTSLDSLQRMSGRIGEQQQRDRHRAVSSPVAASIQRGPQLGDLGRVNVLKQGHQRFGRIIRDGRRAGPRHRWADSVLRRSSELRT